MGGGLIALPVLIWCFGVKEAISLLSITQFIGSVSRAYIHRETIDWKVVGYFALGSMPIALIASFIFVTINSTVIVRILGVLLILVVIYSRLPFGRSFLPFVRPKRKRVHRYIIIWIWIDPTAQSISICNRRTFHDPIGINRRRTRVNKYIRCLSRQNDFGAHTRKSFP